MTELADNSVDLVVTSPPYPMIEMWDDIMMSQNGSDFDSKRPKLMFEQMHQMLDKVWSECFRTLKNGSFMCINIGDATRNLNNNFALYTNASRITQFCEKLGFESLPCIIWRKPSNAPNKFMGSGMLPCGAYVTQEHEYILIFRKNGKREFKTETEKQNRRESGYFWEERNEWFSDLWNVLGIRQKITFTQTRERNASFPIEIPYRLTNMFSVKNDVVLDPFIGLGTTMLASILSERNCVGYEIDKLLKQNHKDIIQNFDIEEANRLIYNRYLKHLKFVSDRISDRKEIKYENEKLKCLVMTNQETDINFHYIKSVNVSDNDDAVYIVADYDTRDINSGYLNTNILL